MTTKTKAQTGWFEVDRDGLRDLVAGRDYGFVANELLQNAFDEEVSHVAIAVSEIERGKIFVVVTDNSAAGFSRLDHAWTLFAPSKKKSDATKRGRFNLGEKYVLAIATSAVIETTTGRVSFSETGRRSFYPEKKTTSGSIVSVEIPVTPEQREEIVAAIRRILVPENVRLVFDNAREGTTIVPGRKPIATATKTLSTVLAGADGKRGLIFDAAP